MKAMRISRMRALIAGAVLALIVVGLATHAGTGTWSALGFDVIAAVCPLGILETMLGAKEIMLHPLVLLGAIAIAVIVLGKAFCAWACPVPWLQLFFHPREKHAGHTISRIDEGEAVTSASVASACSHNCGTCPSLAPLAPVGGARDGLQLDTRHFALFGALGSAAVFGFPVFCLVCPIGLAAATLAGVWHLFQLGETTWGLVAFPVILLIEVVFFRKWCAKICPLSALMSLVASANRTFRPQVDEEKCLRAQGIDCRACVEACPEQLDPHSAFIPECSKCGACAETCPAHAIKIKALPRR